MSDLTETTVELVKQWKRTEERKERAYAEAAQCDSDFLIARNELGKWLCPGDAMTGETFSIWHGKELLVVTYVSWGIYAISTRRNNYLRESASEE